MYVNPVAEEAMRLRLLALFLSLSLSVALPSCSRKPSGANDAGDTSSSGATNPPDSPASTKTLLRPVTPLVVPAGTELTVRLGQTVGSKISQPGQSFSATLARAAAVNGQLAIPPGTTASGTVVDAKALGHIAGGGRGAAIGAVAGAGAAAAGSTFTANQEIVLPAESVLSFKLEQPLELK
jgi:hypothetical protein